MLDSPQVRDAIKRGFDHVEELGDGILRGERRYEGKPYAVAYIDLADEVIARSEDLDKFQEKLLGPGFFALDNDLRWNSYLYVLAGPKSSADPRYAKAKLRLESDRNFARKFVLSEDDLAERLVASLPSEAKRRIRVDAAAEWSQRLRGGRLGVVVEQRPRTRTLELIGSGAAFDMETEYIPAVPSLAADPLQTGRLRALSIGSFRPVNSGKAFNFRDVNLVYGVNGTGKTSLLEAIEAFYCGRVRRDPDAYISGFVGTLQLPDGSLVHVDGTTDVPTLKSRNFTWYGRPDPHSSAISQGFSRFNFLDTDAAFRLSSETDPEEIERDLGRLIVGPETARLWNYLTKIEEDVSDKLRTLYEKLPPLKSQVDLVAAEVKRLEGMPTEVKALTKSYRALLKKLGAKWLSDRDSQDPDTADRSRLEVLERGMASLLAAVPSTPVTRAKLHERVAAVREAIEKLRRLSADHAQLLQELGVKDGVARQRQLSIATLQRWHQVCSAGLPTLVGLLDAGEARLTALRKALDSVPTEVPELPESYASLPLGEALQQATSSLHEATARSETASQALRARQQLGESLAALRRDLHDVAGSLIQKTGNETVCPLCGSVHADLKERIDKLIAEDDPSVVSGLRAQVQHARESVVQGSALVAVLNSLRAFSQSRNSSPRTPCRELRKDLIDIRASFDATMREVDQLRTALRPVEEAMGLPRVQIDALRDAAMRVMPPTANIIDIAEVDSHLQELKHHQAADNTEAERMRKEVAALTDQMTTLVASLHLSVSLNATPAMLLITVERAGKQLDEAMHFIGYVSEQIKLTERQSFEQLRDLVGQAIVLLDKALHALKGEEEAQAELKKKQVELDQLTMTFDLDTEVAKNLAKAQAVLSPLVSEYSLNNITRETLNDIKAEVSAIFARVHVPLEYELGDFSDRMFLVRRDTKEPHSVDQVSTGQRSAFALSIFLALNGTASSAPPLLLIDDPIAHVDDLNALSFLDYLRELVLTREKQVFFATADSRLAALFQRKFDFLGAQRFTTIAL